MEKKDLKTNEVELSEERKKQITEGMGIAEKNTGTAIGEDTSDKGEEFNEIMEEGVKRGETGVKIGVDPESMFSRQGNGENEVNKEE